MVLSKAILSASAADSKHNHYVPEILILSASMFGVIYLFSTSLIGMNKKWIKQKHNLKEKQKLQFSKFLMVQLFYSQVALSFLLQSKHLKYFVNSFGLHNLIDACHLPLNK